MRRHFDVLIGVVLLAAAPIAARAEGALGGSIAWARVNGSDEFDGSDAGWKAFIGGYGRILGGEVQYLDFGHLGSGGPRAHAWAADVTGGFPIGIFTPYGKIGGAFVDVRDTPVRDEYRHTKVFWGVGGRVAVVPGFGLRVEYERFNLQSEHEDLLSAGAEFRF